MSPKSFFTAVLGAFLFLAAPAAMAADAKAKEPPSHNYEQTKTFVHAAVNHMKRSGFEKAFAEFNDPKGKWVQDDLYIFVFDMKGNYKATGFKPERTGTNAWTMKDASGQLLVVQEIIKQANRHGEALIGYLWRNPATGKVQNKTSYVVKIDDYVVGAGFYHQ